MLSRILNLLKKTSYIIIFFEQSHAYQFTGTLEKSYSSDSAKAFRIDDATRDVNVIDQSPT